MSSCLLVQCHISIILRFVHDTKQHTIHSHALSTLYLRFRLGQFVCSWSSLGQLAVSLWQIKCATYWNKLPSLVIAIIIVEKKTFVLFHQGCDQHVSFMNQQTFNLCCKFDEAFQTCSINDLNRSDQKSNTLILSSFQSLTTDDSYKYNR